LILFISETLQLVSAAASHAEDAMKRTEKFKKVLEVQVFLLFNVCEKFSFSWYSDTNFWLNLTGKPRWNH